VTTVVIVQHIVFIVIKVKQNDKNTPP